MPWPQGNEGSWTQRGDKVSRNAWKPDPRWRDILGPDEGKRFEAASKRQAMLRMRATGATQQMVADRFDVSQSYVRMVLMREATGFCWSHWKMKSAEALERSAALTVIVFLRERSMSS